MAALSRLTRDDILHPLSLVSVVTGLKPQTLRRLGRSGRIRLVRPGGPNGNIYMREDDVLALVEHGPAEWWPRHG